MDRDAIERQVTHDLKAALAPIQTSAWLLRQGDSVPAQTRTELVAVLERQAKRLSALIDEAHDWRRAGWGSVTLRASIEDPALLVDAAAEDAGGTPTLAWTQPAATEFRCDAQLVHQALALVLGVSSQRDPARAPRCAFSCDGQRLHCRIADDGPTCEAEALLARPMSGDPSGGLGLSLLTAASLVRRHGGSLVAHARPDGGLVLELDVAALPESG